MTDELHTLSPYAMPTLPQAACRALDPEAFFAFDDRRIQQARNVCRRCPEIRPCLAWALEHSEYGVWAGTTEDQRAELLHRHRKDPA